MSSTLLVQRRDRPWVDSHVAYLIGPVAMPSATELRAAVEKLATAYPHSRLDWALDEAKQRWVTGTLPESIVTERRWADDRSLGELVEIMRTDRMLPHPLAFVRYHNHLGLVMSHGVADGRNGVAMLAAVMHTAITGRLAEWPSRPSGRCPLLTAGVRTFGRQPSLVREALADRYRLDPPDASGTQLPWMPSRRAVVASIPRALEDEMLTLARRLEQPNQKASYFALISCAILQALSVVGLRISRDVNVMVDLRGYLDSSWIDGNFVAAVPMRIDSQTTPHEFSAAIRTTMRSGRPLANQMLSSFRAGGRRRNAAPQRGSYDPLAPLKVAISDLGRSPEIDSLPSVDGRPADFVAAAVPDGPHGLTFIVTHTAGATTITAAFHDNVIDATRIDRAIRMVCADPAGLLDERSSAQ